MSLHLYAYCEYDGVNMWDPSGHWGSKTHRKTTKRAIKRVNKKFIKKLTGEKET